MLRETVAGRLFIITQRGVPVAEMLPIKKTSPIQTSLRRDMKGKIEISDDSCEELEIMRGYCR